MLLLMLMRFADDFHVAAAAFDADADARRYY